MHEPSAQISSYDKGSAATGVKHLAADLAA